MNIFYIQFQFLSVTERGGPTPPTSSITVCTSVGPAGVKKNSLLTFCERDYFVDPIKISVLSVLISVFLSIFVSPILYSFLDRCNAAGFLFIRSRVEDDPNPNLLEPTPPGLREPTDIRVDKAEPRLEAGSLLGPLPPMEEGKRRRASEVNLGPPDTIPLELPVMGPE